MKLIATLAAATLAIFSMGAVAGNSQEVSSKNKDYRPAGAHMTLGEAIHIAEEQALQQHVQLDEYRSPKFLYTPDNHWIIEYVAKVEIPGGYFYVDIDDRSRAAKLMPGE